MPIACNHDMANNSSCHIAVSDDVNDGGCDKKICSAKSSLGATVLPVHDGTPKLRIFWKKLSDSTRDVSTIPQISNRSLIYTKERKKKNPAADNARQTTSGIINS